MLERLIARPERRAAELLARAFDEHAVRIARIRAAQQATGRRVAIMADLPGPRCASARSNPSPSTFDG